MRYTDTYKQLQEELHQNPHYGTSGAKYVEYVMRIADSMKTHDILDYGAGKGTLQKGIPYPIQQYDPFIPEFTAVPRPARLVVCTDVMEHIEPSCLDDVLTDIASFTGQLIFFQIATGPAQKFLSDGRNAHLIQQPLRWWLPKLMEHFEIESLNNQGHGFIAICSPILPEESEAVNDATA